MSRNLRPVIAFLVEGKCRRLIGPTAPKRHRPAEREMKLTNLFSRARGRARYPDEIKAPARLGKDVGNDRGNGAADRSSMADLVRLLKEADDAQEGGGVRRA